MQHRAHLASRADAEKATRTTLNILGLRLEEGLAAKVASQLPDELGRHLMGRPAPSVEKMTPEAFLKRVSEAEGVDLPASVHHTRCVLEVLGEAVEPGLMDKIRQVLPEDWAPLLTAGSAGRMNLRD